MRPIESTADPESAAGPVWANAQNPAIGSEMVNNAMAITRQTAGVIGRRLRRAFNIEQILLSRLDGRAIAGAGDHVRRFRLKARARSTSSVAYALPSTPRLNTASSHACSLSRRNRLQAIHMSGLNR